MLFARVAIPIPIYPHDMLFDYVVPAELHESIREGSLVDLKFRGKKTWGVVWSLSDKTDIDIKKLKMLDAIKIEQPVISPNRKLFLEKLSQEYFYPLGEVCEAALPAAIRKGTDRTLKKKREEKRPRESDVALALNSEQQSAYENILKSDQNKHLLWGVTGSGKTEVYLHLIEEALKQNKTALILVPEIALTPLLCSRFERRFPKEVAVFHSAQKPTALRKSWLDIFEGKKRIALGPRSALFAPLENLGFIIVDEEHDSSYKQEERLRYNTKTCVEELSKLYNAKVVLGSATPSLEAHHSVKAEKCVVHLLEKRAVTDAALPELNIVDLKTFQAQKNLNPSEAPPTDNDQEFSKPISKETFFISPPLEEALFDNLKMGKQSILFLNRRGLGSYILCKSCGEQPECPSCQIKLTPHNTKLLCHYCGFETPTPKNCQSCSATDSYTSMGIGTQAIEKALDTLFPKARVLRLDRDSATKAGELERIIEQFACGEADILIGTQMVAKGHDFPNVTLVGVLLAEMGLSVPDFRAQERTLQLLLQVSGRAGRAKEPGQVFIQTFSPDHPVFTFLQRQKTLKDLEEFMDNEMETRALLNYPPEASLVMLRFDGLQEDEVAQAAETVGLALMRASSQGFTVLGPTPSPIFKVRNRYRYQILLKTKNNVLLTHALHWVFNTWQTQRLERKYRTRLIVDVDPMQML
ncbi:primosomal protein N' [bacterium]|nr:primosomal protein N' [bacterium]